MPLARARYRSGSEASDITVCNIDEGKRPLKSLVAGGKCSSRTRLLQASIIPFHRLFGVCVIRGANPARGDTAGVV